MGRWTSVVHGKPHKKTEKRKVKKADFSEKELSDIDRITMNNLEKNQKENSHKLSQQGSKSSEALDRCKVLVDAVNGIRLTSESEIESSDSIHFLDINKFEEISLQERSQACSDLWRFAFVSDSSREIIARCGGIEACMKIIDESVRLVADNALYEIQQLVSGALAVLRCLCDDSELLSRMIQREITSKVMTIVFDRQQSAFWAISLQILNVVAQHDKAERNAMLKRNLITWILGKADARGSFSMLRDGREKFAIPALEFIEKVLNKDSIRVEVVENTNCVELLCQIYESSNLDTQGVVCRIVSRLCQSKQCKKTLRYANLHWSIASFFGIAFSPVNIGAAGVALGNISTAQDIELALEFIPYAYKIMDKVADVNSKKDWEYYNLALPGTLRAVRAFAEVVEIQRKLAQYIPALNSIMAREESSETSKADAAFILGSIAVQSTIQKNLLNLSPNPLKTLFHMILRGSSESQASAARAILLLSSNPDLRGQIAGYTCRERVLLNKSTLEEANTAWDALDAAMVLLEKQQLSDCRCFGAGIIQNFARLEEICEKIEQRLKQYAPLIHNLAEICSTESSLQARVYAISALGNLSENNIMASEINKTGVIHSIADLLKNNGEFSLLFRHEGPKAAAELQETCIWTLGRLAHSDDAVSEMVKYGVLDITVEMLMSGSTSMRETAASALRNMACFPDCQAFVSHPALLQCIFKILQSASEDIVVLENLVATIANLGLNKRNLPYLITDASCSGFVSLAQKRTAAHIHHLALIIRCAASTLDARIQKSLVDAGIMTVLVRMLKQSMNVACGPAVNSAGAIARLAACDHKYCALCVEKHGLDSLLQLLSNGCEEAQIQAVKALIIIAEDRDYCDLVNQQGGLGIARRAMESTQNDDFIRLLNSFVEILLTVPAHEAKSTTLVDKQIAAKYAVLRAKAQIMRNQTQGSGNFKEFCSELKTVECSTMDGKLPRLLLQNEVVVPRHPAIKPAIHPEDHVAGPHVDPSVKVRRVKF